MASMQMQMIREATRQMTNNGLPSFGEDIDPARLRAAVETAQAAMPLQAGVELRAEVLGGVEAEWSIPTGGREDAVILYIHGGGLVCGNAMTSRGYAGMLAMESRIPVCSFSYRLAPEDPFPAPLDDCCSVPRAALEQYPNKPICLIGESGGALLSIATALRLRDEGVRMPAAVVVFSPVIDFSGDLNHDHYGWDESTVTAAGLKSIAKLYCPDEKMRSNPYVSPYFADFTGCCPLYVTWDQGETLAADAEALVALAKKARVPVEYARYEGCFHAFAPVGRNAPEGAKLLDDTIAFMLKHLHDHEF